MLNKAAKAAGSAGKSGDRRSARRKTVGRVRRRETRFPCDPALVLVEVAGSPEPVQGQIVGVSKTGLRLRLGTPALAASESVRVTHAGMIINGQIRYCLPSDAGSFHSGVEILEFEDVR